MKKVLLFGANGFIGKNLVESFKSNEEYSLVPLTKKDCDLLKFKEVLKVINKVQPDFIINAAYIGVDSNIDFSDNYLFNNIKISTNLLKSCIGNNKIKKVLFFGSGLEYGDSKFYIGENKALCPQNIYAGIKAVNSILSCTFAKHWEIPLVILKPFNLYGPHDTKSLIYKLIDAIKQNKKVVLTKGDQIRDYLYIEDFSRLIIEILANYEKLKNYESYNIGFSKPIKLKEIFNTIVEMMGKRLDYTICPYRKNDYMHQVAEIKKIQNEISWKPETSIKKGLKKTIEWIINENNN